MIPMIHGAAGKAGSRSLGAAGFSISELVIFMAVVGVLFAMSIPSFVTYYQAAALRTDVQQVITLFNQARELAIKQNDIVCVTMPTGSQMALRLDSCAGTVWTGPGTDSAGNMNLPQGFTIAPLAGVTFNYLGAAGAPTTYIMTNSTTSATSTISVSLSGRVTSP